MTLDNSRTELGTYVQKQLWIPAFVSCTKKPTPPNSKINDYFSAFINHKLSFEKGRASSMKVWVWLRLLFTLLGSIVVWLSGKFTGGDIVTCSPLGAEGASMNWGALIRWMFFLLLKMSSFA